MDVSEVVDEQTLKAYLDALPQGERAFALNRAVFNNAMRALPVLLSELCKFKGKSSGFIRVLDGFVCTALYGLQSKLGAIEAEMHAYNVYASDFVDDVHFQDENESVQHPAQGNKAYRDAAFVLTAPIVGSTTRSLFAYPGTARSAGAIERVRKDLIGETKKIWDGGVPSDIRSRWAEVKEALAAEPENKWDFWFGWYDRVCDGVNWYPDDVMKVYVKWTDERSWRGDPAKINVQFDKVFKLYRAEDDEKDGLYGAAPFDFTFDDLVRVIRLIGIDDNLRHLQEPEVVRSFLNDGQEVRDGFIDFVDDARDMQGGNFVGPLRKRAERIVSEFSRIEENLHIRAERIVILAKDLELFSKDQKAVEDLGETLFAMLCSRLDQLKRLCRRHFGPSYVSMAPLANLKLEQIDKEEVVRVLDEALGRMGLLPNEELYELDQEGMAIFNDMLQELRETRAAISNATDEEFVAILEMRFAESSSALGLSIGKFYERSAQAIGNMSHKVDLAIRTQKRAKGVDAIIDALRDLGGGS